MTTATHDTYERGSWSSAVPHLEAAQSALFLTATVLLAGLAYYLVGYDQGVTSIFGDDTHIHEFVHDSRHFLGFPCH
ncbi:MAG: CbtB-domain containing protein [Gordonia sp. (in: high G+C Gram-positive bacteria)]